MNKILIVEDNKTLAKLIAKKIKDELKYEVDLAHSFSEAKKLLNECTYFITLLDLNLPDAPDGEIVDYVLNSGSRVIVLSGNIDKEFRKSMLKKNIIDYVNKSGGGVINYIIHTLRRLDKNQKHKVLVVDDSMLFRKQLKGMLENLFYQVITVAHGEEALGMLKTHPDISLVLTDYNMPVMDGLKLTNEIRKKYTKNDISIIALSSNDEDEVNAMFLKHGANDYIKKPFSKEEFSCRINNTIEALENIHIITNHSNRDYLTGLYNRRYFFKDMNEYFADAAENSESFAIGMINIDNFKNINNTFGHESGDKAIVKLSEILRANTNQNDLVARFTGEEFYIVLKNINYENAMSAFERLRKKVEKSVTVGENGEEIKFTVSIGVAINHEDTLDDSLNNADMMLYNAKQNGRNQVVFN